MLTRARWWTGLAAIAVTLSLGACSGGGVSAPPASSPAEVPPTSDATPVAAIVTTLQFSGSAVRTLDAGGEPVSTTAFDDGSAAVVELITTTVGMAPEVSDETEEGCAGPHTSFQWDGAVVTAWTGTAGFVVGITSPTLGGIRLETTGGFAPGDDIAAFAAAAPADNVGHPTDTDTFLAFDVLSRTASDGYSSPVGAVGYAIDGVLTSVLTPAEWSSFYC